MKLHLITIGKPKLAYAVSGWHEYVGRIGHYHQLRTTHIADKHNDTAHLLAAINNAYCVGLSLDGRNFSSPELAEFLDKRAVDGREVAFVIGGPDGVSAEVCDRADAKWSFSNLTFPHDLAMVVLVEALYRASSISAGQQYHK